jgi:hypothetical protein
MGRRAVELLRNPGSLAAMVQAAIAAARRYSSENVVPRYEELYQEVLSS